MARKVKWTIKAQQERKDILQYWVNRNKSSTYSKKLSNFLKKQYICLKPSLKLAD